MTQMTAVMQHKSCYNDDTADTLSVRIDDETRRQLEQLTKDGRSRNAAIVAAIRDAYRRLVCDETRRASERLAANPEYQAEIRAAREDMGGYAW